MKWGFIPQNTDKPVYLVVNADEGEPGTCKDLPLMTHDPHSLIEGAIIAAYAIRAHHAFIYIRGEAVNAARRVRHAVAEAYEAGYLGENILDSGFDLDIVVHSGAGAYICGEETALLDSLEGYRGSPGCARRSATHGLYAARPSKTSARAPASRTSCSRAAGGARWHRESSGRYLPLLRPIATPAVKCSWDHGAGAERAGRRICPARLSSSAFVPRVLTPTPRRATGSSRRRRRVILAAGRRRFLRP